MESDAITLDVLPSGGIICELRSPKGRLVAISVSPETAEPEISGDDILKTNSTIVDSLRIALHTHAASQNETLNPEEQKALAKKAKDLSGTAAYVADISDHLSGAATQAWCSHCLMFSVHQKAEFKTLQPSAYLCSGCGAAVTDCAVPGCEAKAIRPKGLKSMISYCAEHRHDIPSFERAADKLEDITDFRSIMTYNKVNVARHSKHVTTGVAFAGAGATAAFMAAPAIGGAIGVKLLGLKGAAATSAGLVKLGGGALTAGRLGIAGMPLLGLNGAAATSASLAKLGGGALIAGGLGVAAGTTILAAAGGAIGGAYGTRFLSGYLNEDKSFSIEKLRDGTGPSVIIARGFTTEKSSNWRDEVRFAELMHDDPTIYQLTWGAKEIKDLAAVVGGGVAGGLSGATIRGLAASAGRATAKKLGPIGLTVGAIDLIRNPWHVAVSRAEKAGRALAAILAKNDGDDWILIGHSLGGRVMVHAALALAEKSDAPRVRTIRLFGAAISTSGSWHELADTVSGSVHNYHSRNDAVLKYLYTTAQGGKIAVGYAGFNTSNPVIINHDVSDLVENHSEYFRRITTSIATEMAE